MTDQYSNKETPILHREEESGPAVEYPNGEKAWYLNGEFNHEDGPVVEWALTLDQIAEKFGIPFMKIKKQA